MLDLSEFEPPKALYLHVPFCRTRCRYCAFLSSVDWSLGDQQRYVDSVVHQLQAVREWMAEVETIYVGGGTPSVLPPRLLGRLLDSARRSAPAAREVTVEANPESTTGETVRALCATGVTRLSLGVQSVSPRVLDQLGRSEAGSHVVHLREVWHGSLSLDLLLDAPEATPTDSNQAALFAAQLGAEHVSAYILTPEPRTPIARDIAAGSALPDTDALDQCASLLRREGLHRYEVSNFARPGHECVHNRRYWQPSGYLGLGPGAVSTLYGSSCAVRLNQPRRAPTESELSSPFAAASREDLSVDQLWGEYLMLRLRTADGISRTDYARRFGTDLLDTHAPGIERMVQEGLLRVMTDRIAVPGARLSFADRAVRELFCSATTRP